MLKLLGALAYFVMIMGVAAIGALAIAWTASCVGGSVGVFRSWFLGPTPLAIDPVVGHVEGLRHSYDRGQAHANAPENCTGDNAGGSCGDGSSD